MKVTFYGALIAVALALAAPLGMRAVHAQDVQFSSFAEMSSVVAEQNARIEQLEAHLASLSRTTTSGIVGDGCGCNGGSSCGACGCNDCCDQSMVYGGLEIVALKVFQSEGNYGNNDYQPGARIWLGAQRADGLGIRVRYFNYDQEIGGDNVLIENFDIELTDAWRLGNWDGILSGGFRYGEFIDDFGSVETYAAGITVGFQANRWVNDRFAIFAAVQESLLYGNDVGNDVDDVVFSITEIQLGVQANRCLNNGSTMFVRTGVEGQFYAQASDNDSEGLGLFGFFATVGVMR